MHEATKNLFLRPRKPRLLKYFYSLDDDCCQESPCIAFEFRGDSYAANECRYDYHHKESWCATSLGADGKVDDWKVCDMENGQYSTDRISKKFCLIRTVC